jgi:hypothetical protein
VTDLTIEQRVANGVAWLDENVPGWLDRIELPTLDMKSDCRCVIGQVVGKYNRIIEDSGSARLLDNVRLISFEEAARLGFDAVERVSARGDFGAGESENLAFADEFAALQSEWTRVIAARREAVSNA